MLRQRRLFFLLVLLASTTFAAIFACGRKKSEDASSNGTFDGKIPADWNGDTDWSGSAFKILPGK